MPAPAPSPDIVHATTIAIDGRGVMIRGASGSGKSGLALQLMALGAALVADDRTVLTRRGDAVIADVPAPLSGLIEARGIGLLRAAPAGPVPLVLVIDLDHVEDHRMPPTRSTVLLDAAVPVLHKVDNAAWPAGILQYLKAGRREPE